MMHLLSERHVMFIRHVLPVSALNFYTGVRNSGGYSLTKNLKDCYYVLRVSEDCSDDEIREAYINLVKEYHPDSPSSSADQKKFSQIEAAYRTIQEQRRKDENEKREREEAVKASEEQEAFFDIRHTAPQHRQYLSHEGNGKEEKTTNVDKESGEDDFFDCNLLENPQMKTVSQIYENAVMEKHKGMNRKGIVGNVIDRLAEFHVQEAMARGEFSNLKGEGQPLQLAPDHNPLIDKTTHQLNKVLINNGFAPDWVMLAKDIRQNVKSSRDKLLLELTRAGLDHQDLEEHQGWKEAQLTFRHEFRMINEKIQQLNLITPFLQQQMVPYNVDKELKKIQELYSKLSECGNLPEVPIEEKLTSSDIFGPQNHNAKLTAKMIWSDFKALFLPR